MGGWTKGLVTRRQAAGPVVPNGIEQTASAPERVGTTNATFCILHSAFCIRGRLTGLDRLRVGLTMLVIAHHVGQAYGPTGGQWPVFEPQRAAVLGPFFSVNAAFFMGLFFFLAGVFTPHSADRKGAATFLADRLLRLGVPLALFALVLFPLIGYGETDRTQSFPAYLVSRIASGELEFGHLWFVLHLLIYAVLYALWRVAGGRRLERLVEQVPVPGHRALLGYTVALALVTALVRVWYPIDAWPRLFGIVPAELAHLPQYLSLFVLGLIATRAGWIEWLPAHVGRVWLGVGLVAAGLRYAYSLAMPSLVPGGLLAGGGPDWRSLVWSSWEAVICVGLCVGLVSLATRAQDAPGELERNLAATAYGAYLFHIFPVVGLQSLLLPLPLEPFSKFALVTIMSVPASFLLAAALRRLPGARRVL